MYTGPDWSAILRHNRGDIIDVGFNITHADHMLALKNELLTYDPNDTLDHAMIAEDMRNYAESQELLCIKNFTAAQEQSLVNPKHQYDIPTISVKTVKDLNDLHQEAPMLNSDVASGFAKTEEPIEVKEMFDFKLQDPLTPIHSDGKVDPSSLSARLFKVGPIPVTKIDGTPVYGSVFSPGRKGTHSLPPLKPKPPDCGPGSDGNRSLLRPIRPDLGCCGYKSAGNPSDETRPPSPIGEEEESFGHVCNTCGLSFRGRKELSVHARCIHSKYVCSGCRKEFKSYLSILWHRNSNPTACGLCRSVFDTRADLMAHRAGAHPPGPACKTCASTPTDPTKLREHYRLAHSLYPCRVCDELHATRSSGELHEAQHFANPNNKNNCPICMSIVPEGRIMSHLLRDHAAFRCDTCLFHTDTLQALKVHTAGHARQHWCCVCRTWFETSRRLERHVEAKHGCRHCGETFLTPAEVGGHEEGAHGVERREEGTREVTRQGEGTQGGRRPEVRAPPPVAASRRDVRRPRLSERSEASVPARPSDVETITPDDERNDSSFPSGEDVRVETEVVESSPEKKRARPRPQREGVFGGPPGPPTRRECQRCDASFITGSALERHYRRDHGAKVHRRSGRIVVMLPGVGAGAVTPDVRPSPRVLYKCDFCSRLLDSMDAYAKHRDMHKIRYQCKLCRCLLTSLENLMKHEATHSVEYSCDVCGVHMGSMEELWVHEKTHTVKYQCRHCGVLFERLETLAAHECTLHTAKYECNVCRALVDSAEELSTHESAHGIKYECKYCKRLLDTSAELGAHENSHLTTGPMKARPS